MALVQPKVIFPDSKSSSLTRCFRIGKVITSPAKDTDTATILFTSGTTGVSKGCLLSHRYAVRTAENMIDPFRITSEDCVYSPYPLSHIGAAYYDILPTMMMGGRVILRRGFSLSNFWREVNDYGVTWFMMLGSVQQLLWANPASDLEKSHKTHGVGLRPRQCQRRTLMRALTCT